MVWPELDGQRRILVDELLEMLRHEGLARYRAHGFKQERIVNAARLKMPLDHEGTVACIAAVQDFGALQGHDDKTIWPAPGSTLIWIRSRRATTPARK